MLFPSPEFLFFFLPLVFLLTRIGSLSIQNIVLLAASLVFYYSTDSRYFVLFCAVLAFTYLGGRVLSVKKAKPLLVLFIGILLLPLLFYKYMPPLSPVLSVFGLSLPTFLLPVGISFYSFQAISYLADIYRGEVYAAKNPIPFCTYLALFPQLVAGPIVRYSEVERELSHRTPDTEEGLYRFLTGFLKKVLLADAMGVFFSGSVEAEAGALSVLFGLIAAAMQIYFDFSGYSDMAIGLGLLFGFRFPENFRYPYIAKSASDFWRRWHITLSSFFKSYVYIPLGGNRNGRLRTLRNLLIVWALTGIWHGASLNFLLWGLFWFLFLSLEKFTPLGAFLKKLPSCLSHLYAWILILFSWWLFSFPDLSLGARYLQKLGSGHLLTPLGAHELLRFFPFFLLSALFITPLPARLFSRLRKKRPRTAAMLLLLSFLLGISYLLYRDYSPFLYYRF